MAFIICDRNNVDNPHKPRNPGKIQYVLLREITQMGPEEFGPFSSDGRPWDAKCGSRSELSQSLRAWIWVGHWVLSSVDLTVSGHLAEENSTQWLPLMHRMRTSKGRITLMNHSLSIHTLWMFAPKSIRIVFPAQTYVDLDLEPVVMEIYISHRSKCRCNLLHEGEQVRGRG